jgi:hypothetical protein
MRFFSYLVIVASAFLQMPAQGAESANARIWCLSLRFQEGTDSFGDTLDLSSIGGTPNGELLPYNGLTYVSAFLLNDFNYSGVTINGTIFINLPPVTDVNGNGFNDFFESALGVNATTVGSYTTVLGNGTVTANWSRGAGSKDGSCGLHLVDNAFGDLGYFTHTFELIEYTGPLLFTPGSNTVSGSVNLAKTGDPTSQLQGPIQFVKVSTNRFNQLILQPGGWTNATAQTLNYTNGLFQRDLPWTTNYYGFVEFDDGDPSTAAPDYLTWILSIDDTNDANHNGIPDFSDDPQGISPPNAPRLALALSLTNVLLSISGDVGHAHDIQQSLVLPATNWQTVASVTLTNSPQTLLIPSPPGPAAFWRAVAH